MKHLPQTLLAILIALAATSCGKKSPEDQAAADLIDIYDELGDTLESIDDAESASAAAEKFGELEKQFGDIIARTKSFDQNPSSGMKRKMEKSQKRLQESMNEMKTKLAENPALLLEVMPALIKMSISGKSAVGG